MKVDLPIRKLLPRPRHPFLFVVWGTALTMTALLIYTAVWILPRTDIGKDFGWNERYSDGNWYVSQVDPAGLAAGKLEIGDRLIHLNGDGNISLTGTNFYRRDLERDEQYRLRIARPDGDHEYELTVRSASRPLSTRLAWFVESFVWLAVALLIGFARPEQPLVRLAFIGAVVVSLFFLEARIFPPHMRHVLINPFQVVVGYHFFYRFPEGAPSGKVWSLLLVLLYGAGAFIVSTQQSVEMLYRIYGSAEATRFAAAHYAIIRPALFASFLTYNAAVVALVAVIPRNYLRVTDPDQRRRIRWIAYGSLVGLAPLLLQSVRAIAGFSGLPLGIAVFAFPVEDICLAFIPISVAYVVLKHRLFDIRVVLRRGVQYLFARRALQSLLALPAIALVYTVVTGRNQTIVELVTGHTGYIYWMAAAGVSLKFRRPMRAWLDRKFFREQYDSEQLLVGVLDDLGKLDSVSEASKLAVTRLDQALHPKIIYLWRRNAQDLNLTYASRQTAAPSTIPSVSHFLSLIEHESKIIEVGAPRPAATPEAVPDSEAGWLSELGVVLLVPVVGSSERLLGVLMLGEKMSEQPYGATDRRLLQAIARQLAAVRENLDLKARVGEEQRIRHEVLAHLEPRLLNLLKECPTCGACFDSGAENCDREGEPLTLTLPVERTIDDRYRLDQLIGKGGMGSVYEARDLRLERQVAAKIMTGRAFGEENALRRFQREARAVARLNHSRIVSVFDYGVLEGKGAYIIMERVHGETLRARLERNGRLQPSAAADLFEQLLDGVAAAHEQGIVHRDLKPENVLVQPAGHEGLSLKILDFGLAKFGPTESGVTATALTHAGMIVGTFGYMAPEQLSGAPVDTRTDIFAIGVMLAEVLTGRRPFGGQTQSELLRSVLLDPYHLPVSSPEILAVDAILQRCIAKRPDERIASVARLRGELIPALRACPPLLSADPATSSESKTTAEMGGATGEDVREN